MKIKVPFKLGFVFFEKELDFIFKLSTLECATEEILKCELHEVADKDPVTLNIALFYAGYVTSCRRRYKRPIYTLKHAEFWITHLSKEGQEQFRIACKPLFNQVKGEQTEEKKK